MIHKAVREGEKTSGEAACSISEARWCKPESLT